MENSLLTIGLAFLEGLALILSPCILPVLPFILSGSIDGGKKRPIGITVGFVASFAVFTLFSKELVKYSGIDINIVRDVSFVLLALFGIVMISTTLTEKFNVLTGNLARLDSDTSSNPNGFFSGVWFGCLVGLIWTPCAGPILAAVIVQSIIQTNTLASVATVVAFGIGAGIPMLLIALFGRSILAQMGFLKRHSMAIRKILGVIILVSVAYLVYGNTYTPLQTTAQQNSVKHNNLINGLNSPYPAPEIIGATNWINSKPLQISELKGKVVLIDFWTYSCINCVRTLPYLKDWYAKYHDKGLVIIGIHSPEFEFEKNSDNVKQAVKKDGILYPVAQDNYYGTWQSFHNQYWPAHYLINKDGEVVYTHFGEGDYNITENNIRFLLGLNATKPSKPEKPQAISQETPETYFGYERADRYSSPEPVIRNGIGMYTYPPKLNVNNWALEGQWNVSAQYITSAGNNAAIKIRFNAKKVYVVMGNSTPNPIKVGILLDSQPADDNPGKDVHNSSIMVQDHTLYELLSLDKTTTGTLELTVASPGVEIYTFTFGE